MCVCTDERAAENSKFYQLSRPPTAQLSSSSSFVVIFLSSFLLHTFFHTAMPCEKGIQRANSEESSLLLSRLFLLFFCWHTKSLLTSFALRESLWALIWWKTFCARCVIIKVFCSARLFHRTPHHTHLSVLPHTYTKCVLSSFLMFKFSTLLFFAAAAGAAAVDNMMWEKLKEKLF